ncbi:MAG: oxygen-independent coproporphyrinogen III oxidase [Flavobacteriia bacterium]|nr:oxygen-independent coproporphyrinogen III oxidase [Flavobacteriia bacterium]
MSRASEKYNLAVPRYTSYPPVPHWNAENFNIQQALSRFVEEVKRKGELSLYFHLPFCEALCTYCGCNKRITKNHKVEQPYSKNIVTEWKMYLNLLKGIDFKISGIHLGGGTPTFFNPENLTSMLEQVLEGQTKSENFAFSFEGHPANTKREHLQALYELGFRRMSLGIQDFDPKVQKAIHRWQSVEQVKKCVDDARSIGYNSINFDLIYGLPFQSTKGLDNTFTEVTKMLPERIAFYSYAHVPWVSKSQRAYDENDLPSPSEKTALYNLGCEMLNKVGYVDVGMDHFVLPGDELFEAREERHLHRNFMGYTHDRETLQLGLGVSSISDAFGAYWQNEKVVEDWAARIESGELPIFKGHLMAPDQIEVRDRILKLSCYFKLNERDLIKAMQMDSDLQKKLYSFVSDGLIIIDSRGLKVTPKGKAIVRVVCAAFDPGMAVMREGVFSKAV